MPLRFTWPCLAAGVLLAGAVAAQPLPDLRPSLNEAVEQAWRLTAESRSARLRAEEFDARTRAAASFMAGAPSVGVAHRTDRPGTNAGLRESEVELSVPLWRAGVRNATLAQVDADRAALGNDLLLAKAKVASEVRDLAAQVAVSRIERDIAVRRAEEARVLADDVGRRVRAGDSARVDLLQAEGTRHQARAAAALAEAALQRLLGQWTALTGGTPVAALDETPLPAQEPAAVAAARTHLRAAEAKLRLTEADRSDPLEVGVGVTRERPSFGAGSETSMRIALRVPLGSYGRNGPKLAAARAELEAAQAQADIALRTADAERASAQGELEAARVAETSAAARAGSAAEVHRLLANAWRLGETDLPTRLRAEAERFDAERAHARAQIDTKRAISRLNQANGILP
ncbi:MAG: TolC family protein [Burkholderiaceae bacterium]